MKPLLHSPLSVVIADDHALIRSGIRVLLENMSDFRLLGEAQDGEELCELVARYRPDIVITDLKMPNLGGLDAMAKLQRLAEPPRVVVLTMQADPETIKLATERGAMAFLSKDALLLELELALREVARGGRYVSASVSDILLSQLAHADLPQPQDDPHALLSPRQLEVLKLLASGCSIKEAAYALHLSPKTVETHRAQLLQRLGVRDNAALVVYAIRHGLRDMK